MKLKVQALSQSSFDPFGTFLFPEETGADRKGAIDYYPDRLVGVFEAANMSGISILWLEQRDYCFNIAEKHEQTEEIIGGFPGDVVFHVAPASLESPQPEDFKVFLLPAGGFVRLKRKVWHHAPFPARAGRMYGIVILPPFTYCHDSHVVHYQEPIEIDFSDQA